MAAVETASRLAEFPERRGAGTDAERRAAQWLASELSSRRRDAVVEDLLVAPRSGRSRTPGTACSPSSAAC